MCVYVYKLYKDRKTRDRQLFQIGELGCVYTAIIKRELMDRSGCARVSDRRKMRANMRSMKDSNDRNEAGLVVRIVCYSRHIKNNTIMLSGS